ncbi:MAG: heme ABC exporter ATP-binding protein CcmA [Thermoactinomyces sp.]
MLELKNLTKFLGDKPILKNVTLTLEKGEVLAIIGPNGAGKSTLFKCIAGLLKPTGGQILFNGEKAGKNSAAVRKKIGFLGHRSSLYNALTPVENLMFYGKLHKVDDLERKVKVLLKETSMYMFKDMPVRSFSRGMMQRLAIARVLLPDPEILLLDEPYTGLDQDAISLLNRIIKEKKEAGTSILLISHDFEQVCRIADRIAILKKGKLAADINRDEIFNLQAMKQWYGQVVSEE